MHDALLQFAPLVPTLVLIVVVEFVGLLDQTFGFDLDMGVAAQLQ